MQYTLVNSNDNFLSQQLYLTEVDCLSYIPAAQHMIDRYVAAYWKNNSNDLEYVDMELILCRYLQMETPSLISRKLKVKWIARVLNISPLKLYNDTGQLTGEDDLL